MQCYRLSSASLDFLRQKVLDTRSVTDDAFPLKRYIRTDLEVLTLDYTTHDVDYAGMLGTQTFLVSLQCLSIHYLYFPVHGLFPQGWKQDLGGIRVYLDVPHPILASFRAKLVCAIARLPHTPFLL